MRSLYSHKQSLYYTYCISLLIFSNSSKQLTILGLAVRMAAACSGLLRTRFCTLMSSLCASSRVNAALKLCGIYISAPLVLAYHGRRSLLSSIRIIDTNRSSVDALLVVHFSRLVGCLFIIELAESDSSVQTRSIVLFQTTWLSTPSSPTPT